MKAKTSPVSPRLNRYFQDYAAYHQTPGNKFTHYTGIPLIVMGLLGLLSHLSFGWEGLTESTYFRLDGGTLLLTLGAIFYIYLDWKLAIPFSLILAGFYFLARTFSVPINWALFIIGWILQGIGHAVYEKRSPAFTKNIIHILIGPFWIFAQALGLNQRNQG